jgi:hypothetical protein
MLPRATPAGVVKQNDPPEKAGKVGHRMVKTAKEITTTEVISVSPEEGVDEVKEEVKKVPSRLRRGLHRFAAVGERVSVQSRVSGSDVVVGSGLGEMYCAKFEALAKEHVRPDKG